MTPDSQSRANALVRTLMRAEGISQLEAELRLFYECWIGAGDVCADTLSVIIDIELAKRADPAERRTDVPPLD